MRISILSFSILLTVGLLYSQAAAVNAQSLEKRIDIDFDHESLDKAIKQVESKADLTFAYDANYLALAQKIVKTSKFRQEKLETILATVLNGTGIAFKEQAGNILLFKQAYGKLNGKVTDETRQVLPGATVKVVDSTNGTTTGADGSYSLNLPEGVYSIEVSFTGFQKSTIKNVKISANKTTSLDFSLAGGAMLKEVTVSYGKQRAREVTGSIGQLNAAPLEDMPVIQFAQTLQGKVAGVQVAISSGQPGRGIDFRIRGAASLFSSNQPLFVVDGMPITGSINNINPDEIESYSILKDAAASALYGSRAANGVVLITTKHAKPGDAQIEFHSNYGVQKLPTNKVPKMMTAREWADFENEYYQDRVKYEGYTGKLDTTYLNPERYGTGTNWFDVLTRTAPIQSYDLTIKSAREKSSSTVIAGYQDQQGVLLNTGTKLFSLRINEDLSIANNKIKIGFNLAPSYRMDHNNRLNTDGVGGLFERIFEASPLAVPVNPDGSYPKYAYSPPMVQYFNPYAQFMLSNDNYLTTRILGNGYFNYEFVKGLTLKTNLGVDKGAETRNLYNNSLLSSTSLATATSSSVDNYSWTAEANLQYNKSFGDHNIEALVGYSAQKFNQVSNSVAGTGFPSDDVPWLSAATSITSGSSNTTSYALLSAIGRINYNYKGRYLLSGAIRRDGSSRFGSNQQYGNFPSVSAGWIVSDESFMEGLKVINLFKIRSSYGLTGNNFFTSGNYPAQSTIGSYNYVFNGALVPGTTISSLGNSNLAWERNKQFDIGFDLSMLNNRISVTYDYYHKLTDGLIQDRPVPQASGFSTIKYNVGAFAMWGHEITVNTVNLNGKLNWTTNFNISFDRNIIKSLVSPGYIRRNNTVTSDYYRNQVGHHLGEFYGFVNLGLYKDANDLATSAKYGSASDVGTLKMKDLNGDGVIDDVNDRTFIGDPTPKFTFGLTNSFRYQKFDLSISMAGSVGGKILNAAKWAYRTNMDGSRMLLAAAADRWRSPEDPGSGIYPRTKTGTTAIGRSVNTQWVENGSYLTAKNIALGYTFGLKDKFILKSLRLYASVQQAFIISGYSGMNPEINFAGLDPTQGIGVDENAYPVPRTFSIGLTSTFK
ncbi:SusC/RagA family TonB-linked outer membrane protein [Mucilaginibacter sp. R11]|uniref:SusC/RagA family TonB-linked outer membrane protein n=2 Tax=Mucilaginibacter agri TaxID=2695265 RepID=A0A966DUD5_9SPHI|nr:SusC/RagA family TonB-linked outer membrane protein [Mucilaginibacter agri]